MLSIPGNETFGERLAECGGWESRVVETRRFPDGETYVRIHGDVAGKSIVFVCSLARPDDGFLPLVFAADAARDLGARDVTLVAPYLAYMRQDRRFQSGEAVTSRTFARLLSSTFNRLITVDPHLHRYTALSDLYRIPTDTLHAAPLLGGWIAQSVKEPLIVGPDQESDQWVSSIAGELGAPYVTLRKIRQGDRAVAIEVPDLSRWRGRQPVLVDDIASSGRTLIEAARQLSSQGFPMPVVVVVHGLFAEDSYQRLAAVSDRVVSADSVPHGSNVIGLAGLIANALEMSAVPNRQLVRHRRPAEGVEP